MRTMLIASLLSGSLLALPTFAADKPTTTPPAATGTKAPAVAAASARPTRLTVRQMLNARLPELKMDGVPLTDAIDFLRDVSGANLHVNWRALEAAGVTRDTVITSQLRNVPVRKALSVILSQVSPEGSPLAFYNDGGVIEVTTQAIADEQLITRSYFVGDILMEIPDFTGPRMSLSSKNSGGKNGGGGGSSGGIFEQDNTDRVKGETKTERADKLVSLITQLVRPEIWETNGGTAKASYFNGYLIISAPRSAHELIGGPID